VVQGTQAAFFSYSRDDSEFAIRLAGDLKAAGANVWMDQLDIEPGMPWDRAVENAVTVCPRMLVILSPTSVNSDNVRDEISFALSKGKRVIPVLYRECDVPFRLARLQHIDFRSDYTRGLKVLLKVLSAEQASVAATLEQEKAAQAERNRLEQQKQADARADQQRLDQEEEKAKAARVKQLAQGAQQEKQDAQERREKENEEQAEQERLVREKKARAKRAQLKREKKAQEQAEQERLERERKARAKRARLKREKQAQEQAEHERLERENHAREQAVRERMELEKQAQEQAAPRGKPETLGTETHLWTPRREQALASMTRMEKQKSKQREQMLASIKRMEEFRKRQETQEELTRELPKTISQNGRPTGGRVANAEHLAKLKAGVEAWNAWRRASPGILPDLSGVNLRGANLEGFNLARTDLRGSDLTGANLRGVNVSGATVGGTTFQNVDLSSVTGLEDINHSGQSAVSLSTYYRSHGKIPESFLRGCRVPDEYISYMRSHVVNTTDVPVDVCTCFISYSNKDAAFAVRVHAELKKRALNPWLDLEDLKIGDRFQERIEESIVHCTKLLVVLSTDSVNSRWVEREVQAAFEKERRQSTTVLLPVRLDDAVMESPQAWAAEIRRTRHIGDFREWKNRDSFQKSLDRLIRDLKAQNSNPK